jgi:hypothetical protein
MHPTSKNKTIPQTVTKKCSLIKLFPPKTRSFRRLHVNNPFYLPRITEKTGEKVSDSVFVE